MAQLFVADEPTNIDRILLDPVNKLKNAKNVVRQREQI